MNRRKCFVLAALGLAFWLSFLTEAQAGESLGPSSVRPATPAELGFSGSRAEIREQAARIAEPGDWGRPSAAEIAPLRKLVSNTPQPVLDPFEIAGISSQLRKALNGEAENDSRVVAGEPKVSPSEPYLGPGWSLPSNGPAPECRTSGQRIRLFYVYPRGYEATESWEALKPWSAIKGANMKFILESMVSSEGERFVTLNVDCYPPGHPLAGYPTVRILEIDPLRTDPPETLWGVLDRAERKIWEGDGRSTVYGVRNLLFYTENPPKFAGVGQGDSHVSSVMNRDTQSANYWNHTPLDAAVARSSWMSNTLVHEILHTFGAVGHGHPLSTDGGHCLVESDVMCYEDNGSRAHLYPLISPAECPYYAQYGTRIDCVEALYFRADHGDGTILDGWLNVKWNTIGAENRFVNAYPEWDYSVPCPQC